MSFTRTTNLQTFEELSATNSGEKQLLLNKMRSSIVRREAMYLLSIILNRRVRQWNFLQTPFNCTGRCLYVGVENYLSRNTCVQMHSFTNSSGEHLSCSYISSYCSSICNKVLHVSIFIVFSILQEGTQQ